VSSVAVLTAKRILVVEDDASILRLVTAVLTRSGYAVDTAMNGVDAFEKMEQTAYDAVVLDLMMSGTSGFEVLTRLRASEPQRKFVIIMSAASPEVVARAVSPNVFAALHKPFDINELTAAVGACVAAGAELPIPDLLNGSASGRTQATLASDRSAIAKAAR
jgi:DNA-binding response OmpR family regulator